MFQAARGPAAAAASASRPLDSESASAGAAALAVAAGPPRRLDCLAPRRPPGDAASNIGGVTAENTKRGRPGPLTSSPELETVSR